MTIRGANNTFNTLHKHETPRETHKIHESHETYKTPQTHETRRSTVMPRYSPRSSHHIDMADCTRKMNRELTLLETPTKHRTSAAEHAAKHTPTGDITSAARKLNISMIGAAPFNHLVQKSQKDSRIQIFSVNLRDINIALAPKKHTNLATKLPSEYHEFLDVFSRKDADVLPMHRPRYDHSIELMEGKTPTWGPLYSMSADELKVLKEYIKKMIDKGFIWASSSSAASPVLFARKPGGGLRFCVDYRALNAITIKNCYPLPLIKETLEHVCKAKIFSKINIIAAFNKLRIKEGEEWKTAFRTRYGLYEYLVMPFGLANSLSSFQNYINDILHGMLDVFCTAYIDNILIYSNSKKEHRKHMRKILGALRGAGLQADIDKCKFHITEVNYLGLVITNNGICMDLHKVSAVQQWETPTCVRDVQSFIGYANFYRWFIHGFSSIVAFMIATVKKDAWKNFEWTSACQKVFDLLKHCFTTAPILAHFDYEKECIVETDASDNVSAGVLPQYSEDGKLHPVAFFLQKHSPQEINYKIYNKELLAIIKAFEEWRPMLERAGLPIRILTNHQNLQYFMTTKQLSCRQARWSEYLSRFNFIIRFWPGKLSAKPDALTRRSGDLSKEEDERIKQMQQTVLKAHNLNPAIKLNLDPVTVATLSTPSTTFALNLDSTSNPNSTFNISVDTIDPIDKSTKPTTEPATVPTKATKPTNTILEEEETAMSLDQLLDRGYERDLIPNRVLDLLARGANYLKDLTIADCFVINRRLHYRGLLYVLDYHVLQLRLCKLHHDTPVAGHLGIGNTYELLHRAYY